MFGPSGPGKSTQARKAWVLLYLSGDIINNLSPYRNNYQIVKKLIKEGKPFSEGFIVNILSQEIGSILEENKDVKGIILDGFP